MYLYYANQATLHSQVRNVKVEGITLRQYLRPDTDGGQEWLPAYLVLLHSGTQ